MKDRFGREISYLRLSLTERCQLRCTYCRAGEDLCPKKAELPADEIIRIVRIMTELGINKVRLTGGEPLLRRDILKIIKGIAEFSAIKDISLTTNAQMLAPIASNLKEAGLARVNISLDSLVPEKFYKLTGGSVAKVLDGINAAFKAGLLPVKVNVVLIKGVNDNEIADFVKMTKDQPIDIRFIEYMPIGLEPMERSKFLSNQAVLDLFPELVPIPPRYPSQASKDYKFPDGQGRVGLISAISHQFCGDCNRIRLMSYGVLRLCLGQTNEVDLKPYLPESDEILRNIIQDAIFNKPAAHQFWNMKLDRGMSQIGG